ncbi:hypothetical protein M427DRAFT_149470 [Gonapodya prolifera JEL478]|uniref:Transmembrane protein 18 n=1 Tax=Gonapodya prolifera (strain JEL478) TaxID=1344416 RepID=A0A138ZZ32_GONPJ|nr:hypothetical protein M427DRAFT_149470 [Gonapodya prolifera JEL478]|eukprot:KXS09750.1 hypothetical protein M427DRAFT_149470 [Gonapodya prolifera JEL478]
MELPPELSRIAAAFSPDGFYIAVEELRRDANAFMGVVRWRHPLVASMVVLHLSILAGIVWMRRRENVQVGLMMCVGALAAASPFLSAQLAKTLPSIVVDAGKPGSRSHAAAIDAWVGFLWSVPLMLEMVVIVMSLFSIVLATMRDLRVRKERAKSRVRGKTGEVKVD